MKYIYSFFTLLTAILIFSACSDSSTGPDDSFEGKRFGYWLTTSETTAEWVGSGQNIKSTTQMAAAGDTTIIDDPNNTQVYLSHSGRGEFNISILGGPITDGQHDSLEIRYKMHVETPDSALFIDMSAGYTSSLGDPSVPIEPYFQGTYLCSDSTLATQAIFHHVFIDIEADTLMHVYTLDANGLSPALNALACQ